jgi:hypothetical protein
MDRVVSRVWIFMGTTRVTRSEIVKAAPQQVINAAPSLRGRRLKSGEHAKSDVKYRFAIDMASLKAE